MTLCEVRLLFTGNTIDDLKVDNVIIPGELRDLGVTDIQLSELLHEIADDFAAGNLEISEES